MTQRTKPGQTLAVKGVLLDIDGVICVGNAPLPGSLDAVGRIRAAGLPLRFVTNTTRRPRRKIVADLVSLGLAVSNDDIFTPASIARDFLERQNLASFLVVHPDLSEDFSGLPSNGRQAVVVGDVGAFFSYELLNQAFRKLIHGAEFVALAKNRNFLDRDRELSLDAGAFVAALEYGSGKPATVVGKPSPAFFKLAVESLGCAATEIVMIGDDAEADVGGAMAAGLLGVLVRTGKYRPGQENDLPAPPTAIAENLEAAVDLLPGCSRSAA